MTLTPEEFIEQERQKKVRPCAVCALPQRDWIEYLLIQGEMAEKTLWRWLNENQGEKITRYELEKHARECL